MSFSYSIVEIDGYPVVMNSLDAMYVRAQQRGDTRLMELLEHRAEVHNGGPCYCEREDTAGSQSREQGREAS